MPRARRVWALKTKRELPQRKYTHEEVQFRGSALATYIAERTLVSTHKTIFGGTLSQRTTASIVCATLKNIWCEEGKWSPDQPLRVKCDAALYALTHVRILDHHQLAFLIRRNLQPVPFDERPCRDFVWWDEDFPQLSNSHSNVRRARVTFCEDTRQRSNS
jgi:hypothetical protein